MRTAERALYVLPPGVVLNVLSIVTASPGFSKLP
jgi:hypothetical protein